MGSILFGIPYALGDVPPMKELKAGFLMLLVCVALYIQVDPRIWNGVCQLLARFMIGWN
jgi:hypothetical protein